MPEHPQAQSHEILPHWGRMTRICASNLTIIGSDDGLSPGRRQALTWTNCGILLIGPLETNLKKIVIEINTFSFKKLHLNHKLKKTTWGMLSSLPAGPWSAVKKTKKILFAPLWYTGLCHFLNYDIWKMTHSHHIIYWFRQWLAACLAPNLCLNQFWIGHQWIKFESKCKYL